MHALSKSIDSLARFYTEQNVSNLLVSSMRVKSPQTILDLGSGKGALAMTAIRRWSEAKLYTVDIDQQAASSFYNERRNNRRHLHFTADALDPNLPSKLGLRLGSVDIAVCNPPYIKVDWRKKYHSLFEEAGFENFDATPWLTAELVFLAQNLRLLREGGQAGLIVPEGLITGERSKKIRESLLSQYTIEKVVQLPRRTFIKTEAQTYILVISKRKTASRNILVQEMTSDGVLSEPLPVSPQEGIERLDYSYHKVGTSTAHALPSNHKLHLAEVTESLQRGKAEMAKARGSNLPVFHTTDFYRCLPGWSFDVPKELQAPPSSYSSDHLIAKAGDILIARVGRNLYEQICLVTSGEVVLTDCIFRLRVTPGKRKAVFNALTSGRGRAWLKSVCRGVAARYLSSKSLLDFPL